MLYRKIILFAVVVLIGCAVVFFFERARSSDDSRIAAQLAHDIGSVPTETGKISVYRAALERYGAVRAQSLLNDGSLPHNAVSHAVNHEAGAYLYKTQGADGIKECEDYFENSCYHGFLIAFAADQGIGRL